MEIVHSRVKIYSLIIVTLFTLVSCSSGQNTSGINKTNIAPQTLQVLGTEEDNYVMQVGDEIEVKFYYESELNERVTIRPDGKISLQLIDDVKAAGLTTSDLDKVLTEKYERKLKKPEITVIVKTFSSQKIYIGGEVTIPQ